MGNLNMSPLTNAEKKLIGSSTYYQSYQKSNGWRATANLLRDRMHKNSRGDKRNN
jgi:hypothetical protein